MTARKLTYNIFLLMTSLTWASAASAQSLQGSTAQDPDIGSEAAAPQRTAMLLDRIQPAIDSINARAVPVDTTSQISETGEKGSAEYSGAAAWITYLADGTQNGVLGGDSCSLSVALLGAESPTDRFTDVTNNIITDSRIASVTAVDVRLVTPTLAELNAFDAVLVWSNFDFQNSALLGNNLAGYCDGGGGVVLSMFALRAGSAARIVGGRFFSDNYYCIQPLIGTGAVGAATLGNVFVPDHPLMSGVATFDGGSVASRTTNPPNPLATRIADWSDGNVFAASRYDLGGRRVDLAFYPVSDAAFGGSGNWWDPSTDGGTLMSNALADSSACEVGQTRCNVFGGTEFSFVGPDRLRGNVYTVDTSQTLTDFSMELSFNGLANLYFYVLESATADGLYSVISESIVPTNSTGQRFYSSGPLNVTMVPGRYYAIGVNWGPEFVTYYRRDLSLPRPWALGTIEKLLGVNSISPPIAGPLSVGLFRGAEYSMELCFSGACPDTTPPIVEIDSPGTLTCACDIVPITGTVGDSDGVYEGDILQYRASGAAAWTTAANAVGPRAGVLYNWNTAALSQGFYFIRIVGRNECGLTDSDSTFVYVSKSFGNVDLRSPSPGSIRAAVVCVDGTAWTQSCFDHYTVDYRPAGGGAFSPVDPANPVYTSTVINDPLASWSTHTGPTAVPDGLYEVRLQGVTDCGDVATRVNRFTVDNTIPTAEISEPVPCVTVNGIVPVFGTANDANLRSWSLQYTGGDASGWVTINFGVGPVLGGHLGDWDTTGLRPCAYTLRLVVTDLANISCSGNSHQSIYHVSVNVGNGLDCPGDINGDGVVNLEDLAILLAAFGTFCP